MTFAPRNLAELKAEFDRAINLYCRANVKASETTSVEELIEKLPEDRKNQIKFLQYVLNDVVASDSNQNAAAEFYGALLIMQKDVLSKLGRFESPGMFYANLSQIMGITETDPTLGTIENKPNLAQQVEYYNAVQKYLNTVYMPGLARDNINPEHPIFKKISLPVLVGYATSSYINYATTYAAHITGLPVDGTSVVEPSAYSVRKTLSTTMQLASWDQLKVEFTGISNAECISKRIADTNNLLNATRRGQYQFLTVIRDSLDATGTLDSNTKAAIFTGALRYVHGDIAEEKGGTLLSQKKLGSVTYTEITRRINVDAMPVEDTRLCLALLANYITFIALENPEEPKFRTNHALKACPLNTAAILTSIANQMALCRETSFKTCAKALEPKHASLWESASGAAAGAAASARSMFRKKPASAGAGAEAGPSNAGEPGVAASAGM